jgi:PKD repeat protein
MIFSLYAITLHGMAGGYSIGSGFAQSVEGNGVYPLEAIISYSPANPSAVVSIMFDAHNSRSAREIVRYEWDFGDGNSGNGPFYEHTYNISGIYNVALTIIDANGATNTSNVNITICNLPGSGFARSLEDSGLNNSNISI